MKKLISVGIAAVLAVSCGIQCFATELNEQGNTSSVETELTTSSHYSVTIPKYIRTVKPENVTEEYTNEITASGVLLGNGERLRVICEYSGKLTDERSSLNTLDYKIISGEKEVESGSCVLTVKSGYADSEFKTGFDAVLTADAVYSGQYNDTATFSIEIDDGVTVIGGEELYYTDAEWYLMDTILDYVEGCDETCINGGTLNKITVNGDEYTRAYLDYLSRWMDTPERLEYLAAHPEIGNRTFDEAREVFVASFRKGGSAYRACLEDACYEIFDWFDSEEGAELLDENGEEFFNVLNQLLYSASQKYGLYTYEVSE